MRHFVIGNGPSLNKTPLDKLKGEITWGMNRINLMYDRTSWRPTYYFMVDHWSGNPFEYWMESIRWHWHTPKWLWEVFKDGHPAGHPNHEDIPRGIGDLPHTTWIPRCEHHYDRRSKAPSEWHLPELCTALGGINTVMQLAVLQGASEIVLLGCDLYKPDYRYNHFDPNYSVNCPNKHTEDNEKSIAIHEMARRSSPIPIYNATIGGELEVHPRVKLEDIL